MSFVFFLCFTFLYFLGNDGRKYAPFFSTKPELISFFIPILIFASVTYGSDVFTLTYFFMSLYVIPRLDLNRRIDSAINLCVSLETRLSLRRFPHTFWHIKCGFLDSLLGCENNIFLFFYFIFLSIKTFLI